MKKRSHSPPVIAEVIFDIGYLFFALFAGLWLLFQADGRDILLLYGALTLTLAFGDMFHLVPRVYGQWTNTMGQHRRALGFGKLMTSITMTLFYVLLFFVWQAYFGVQAAPTQIAAIWVLAAIRIVLCLFPQNGWSSEKPPLSWAIGRNLPFLLLGGILVALFIETSAVVGNPFFWMPLAISLSFVFYFIVVLFAERNKKLGVFMLPKTCMYIWIIYMGFFLV